MVETLRNCHDCGAKPGEMHKSGCDTERCSVCGGQWISCGHKGHDPAFARWTGLWPGAAEAALLGIDLNDFYNPMTVSHQPYYEIFFIKPKGDERK